MQLIITVSLNHCFSRNFKKMMGSLGRDLDLIADLDR